MHRIAVIALFDVAYGYSSSGDKLRYAIPWAPHENGAKQKWMVANDFDFGITGDSAAVRLHSSDKWSLTLGLGMMLSLRRRAAQK